MVPWDGESGTAEAIATRRSGTAGGVGALSIEALGYHRRMRTGLRASRRLKLVFFTFWTAFAALATVGVGFFLWADLHGGNATATIVRVIPDIAYTIDFTTQDGVRCEASFKWSSARGSIELMDTFKVHYSRISPCDNVERADDYFARFGGYVIPPVFVIVGVTALFLTRRQPRPEPRKAQHSRDGRL